MRRRAQSSAVGTILLVGIAVVVVGRLVVTGSDVVDDAQRDGPSAAVDVRANATTLSVTHESGDPLPLGETTVVLSGGGSTRRLPLAAFDGDDGDGRATAGETLSTSYALPARSVTVRLVHGPSDLVVVERALSTVSPPGVAPNFSAGVDAYPLQSGQDGGGSFAVASNGTIRAEGNSWKTVPIDGEVTPDTYLTFEFRSSVEGDVHAIGVDSDGPPNWPIYR
jgi:FlaG/FlaF family flagellin (archaellin)